MLPQYFFVYISFHSLKFFGSLSSHFIGNVSHISMVYYNAVNFYNRVSLSNLKLVILKILKIKLLRCYVRCRPASLFKCFQFWIYICRKYSNSHAIFIPMLSYLTPDMWLFNSSNSTLKVIVRHLTKSHGRII